MNQNVVPLPDDHHAEPENIEARMRMEVREIGIPPRPTILLQIDQEMRKDEPDFTHLAKIIGSDVALAAALIKTCNSPFFGFNRKVRTVQEAVLVLGLKLVARTVAGVALQRVFEHVPSMERFWDASATTARVSGWLAKRLGGRCNIRAEDAYTFALFRDCGIPVLMIPFPEYRSVLSKANAETELSFTAIEDQLLSINHAVTGASLAESWLLPDEIVLAIRHHHDLRMLGAEIVVSVPEVSWALIAIAQLAEYLIQKRTGLDQTHEWEKVAEIALSVLTLNQDDLVALLEACQEAVAGDAD